METIYLNNRQIQSILSVAECIGVVETVFKNLDLSQMPPKIYLDIPDGDFRAMPAVFDKTAGIKWCGVHLDKQKQKRKINIFAKVLINDVDSGKLLAIMDGEAITAIRTAAVTGVATDYIAKKDAKVAAFIGCGNQTKYQVEAILAVRKIDKLHLFDLDASRCEYIGKQFGIDYEVFEDVESCVRDADIVTTLTPSRTPFLNHSWLKDVVHINAIGADAEGKREVAPCVLDNVDFVVYDNWEQCSHSGEIQYVKFDDRKQEWTDLGDVVHSEKDLSGHNQTLFDATGLAIEDVATARYIYEKVHTRPIPENAKFLTKIQEGIL
jgi:alanine dehydrogenase|tara:strand:- start:11269 stop:12237 length:969 start_codon:yes stop_codon:yes gene_type:complete